MVFLDPLQVIHPYDTKITDLSADKLLEWTKRARRSIESLNPTSIVSCLTGSYADALPESVGITSFDGSMFDKAKEIGKQGNLLRGPIVDWPMYWILLKIHLDTPTVKDIEDNLRRREYAEPTVKAQVYRTLACPLHRLRADRLVNRYSSILPYMTCD